MKLPNNHQELTTIVEKTVDQLIGDELKSILKCKVKWSWQLS